MNGYSINRNEAMGQTGNKSMISNEEEANQTQPSSSSDTSEEEVPTESQNEYVLNVAFFSFIGFAIFQFFFAMAAGSEAMMTDCAAMAVDSFTYLFNYLAERLKNSKGFANQDLELPHAVRIRKRQLQTLYLELFPPLISVSTLIIVTILAIQDAIETIVSPSDNEEKQPDWLLMLIFSGLNLILDLVNVGCFARADQAVGLHPTSTLSARRYSQIYGDNNDDDDDDDIGTKNNDSNKIIDCEATEETALLTNGNGTAHHHNHHYNNDDDKDDIYMSIRSITRRKSRRESQLRNSTDFSLAVNLNMCSAWTHVCADTLRSAAVLVAAAGAALFPETVTPEEADSWGTIVVSAIIILSLGPLLQGIYFTSLKIIELRQEDKKDQVRRSSHTIT